MLYRGSDYSWFKDIFECFNSGNFTVTYDRLQYSHCGIYWEEYTRLYENWSFVWACFDVGRFCSGNSKEIYRKIACLTDRRFIYHCESTYEHRNDICSLFNLRGLTIFISKFS